MLNETNSELEERSDSAAVEEMMKRTDVQIPARIYTGELEDAYNFMYKEYINYLITEQQAIEAREWNGEWK